jgi:membrane associated rhomboid family serine protease
MLPVRDHLPTRSVAVVNYTLIAANVLMMAYELWAATSGADVDVERWTLVPESLVTQPLANAPTLFSHMFMHASLAHLGGNMLFLWIFGDNVEDALGHVRYAIFYIACGLAAALAQVALGAHSTVPMLGASGAISGVLAAYAFLYPRSPITVLNPIPMMWLFWGLFISLPAWVVILEYFVINLYSVFTSSSGAGGVAFAAHLGGFVSGAILLSLLRKEEPVEHDRWAHFLRPRRA